ncbi:hypothetical protein DENSPDRAFT_624538 [Dentipellis sp. KUC8613]|nr:hypothetical protein DENSPDRAFT_624538 [Dentipellis sp. KUC8613]
MYRAFASHEAVLDVNDSLYGHSNDRRAMSDLSWATMASRHSISDVHMDTDGLATVSRPLVGRKLWVILTPTSPTARSEMSRIDRFIDVSLYDLDLTQYDVEAILLGPGQVFYQRPNQLHWVYGVDPTIVYGRHFYPASSLDDSLYGQVHTQLVGDILTNASHPRVRPILADFMILWYNNLTQERDRPEQASIPHLHKSEELKTFIAVSNAVVFSHTLACMDGEEPKDSHDRRQRCAQDMVAYRHLMHEYARRGYGCADASQFGKDACAFFKACNIHFGKALVSYAKLLDGQAASTALERLPARRWYEIIRRDLGRMWGPRDKALLDLDDWYLSKDAPPTTDMLPHVQWVRYQDNINPPCIPPLPVDAALFPSVSKKRPRTTSDPSPGRQGKKACR